MMLWRVRPGHITDLALAVFFVSLALAAPLQERSDSGAFTTSADLWAQIVANVAPLMALVGERNAKEYLRTASAWHQFCLMSTAPIGVLSILVSVIRLCGSHFLRRLVGRDSERYSDALVELTPLSVSPATSVFSPRAIEIEPQPLPERVAFVNAHVRKTGDIEAALAAFQSLVRPRLGRPDPEIDREVLLGLWGSSLRLEQVAALIDSLTAEGSESAIPQVYGSIFQASLSFRITGVSPTQTRRRTNTWAASGNVLRDAVAGLALFAMMTGVQVAGYLQQDHSDRELQSLLLGVCGYTGIVVFASGMFALVKSVVSFQTERLPTIFQHAMWTFSDATHTQHKFTLAPSANTLVIARPASFQPRDDTFRQFLTTLVCAGLVCSYVIYYLGLRASSWWVALLNLATFWIGALYRALTVRKSLTSIDKEIGEHWIGLDRPTVADSLLATFEGSANRDPAMTDDPDDPLVATGSQDAPQNTREKSTALTVTEKSENNNCIFFGLRPRRNAFPDWSGAQDVMKVAFEMTKTACFSRVCRFESIPLKHSSYACVLRMRLAIYVPGITWVSKNTIDITVGPNFDFDFVCREVVKIFHMCMDQQGEISHHQISEEEYVRLSHVLCGPIARCPTDLPTSMSLRGLLARLQDLSPPDSHKYSVEQTTLLPTMQLASIYDRWFGASTDELGAEIKRLQIKFPDHLALSGEAYLDTLEDVFERERIWDVFMRTRETPGEKEAGALKARDATAGHYDQASLDQLSSTVAAEILLQKSRNVSQYQEKRVLNG